MSTPNAPDLSISGDDRVAFIGKTGCGKTYAAAKLAATLPRLVVLDPKGMLRGKWQLEEWGPKAIRKLRRGEAVRVRVPAPFGNDWEPILAECYAAGNLTVYIDEVYGVTHNGQAGPWLTALYTRGRELKIGVWAATQRPRRIPLFVLSESEWTLAFRLKLPDDAKLVRELIGGVYDHEIKPRAFYIYNDAWDRDAMFYTQIR